MKVPFVLLGLILILIVILDQRYEAFHGGGGGGHGGGGHGGGGHGGGGHGGGGHGGGHGGAHGGGRIDGTYGGDGGGWGGWDSWYGWPYLAYETVIYRNINCIRDDDCESGVCLDTGFCA